MGLKGSWPSGSAYSPLFIPPSPHGSLGAKQSSENASKQVPTQKAECQSAWETVQAQTCSRGLTHHLTCPSLHKRLYLMWGESQCGGHWHLLYSPGWPWRLFGCLTITRGQVHRCEQVGCEDPY